MKLRQARKISKVGYDFYPMNTAEKANHKLLHYKARIDRFFKEQLQWISRI